jgi:hypothetical protein
LHSISSGHARIECSHNSNVKLSSFGKGSFSVVAGSESTDRAGIGFGNSDYDMSKVIAVTIRRATAQAEGLASGSGTGTGSGFGHDGNSTVINLSVYDGNTNGLNSSSRLGIGNGRGDYDNLIAIHTSISDTNITGFDSSSRPEIESRSKAGSHDNSIVSSLSIHSGDSPIDIQSALLSKFPFFLLYSE